MYFRQGPHQKWKANLKQFRAFAEGADSDGVGCDAESLIRMLLLSTIDLSDYY